MTVSIGTADDGTRTDAAAARRGERGRGGKGEEGRHRGEGSDDSSEGTSRTSDASPVLSTSTLGRTPSPPPLGEHRKDTECAAALEAERRREGEERARRAQEARQPTIAVMPVLDLPWLLRPIPQVPETIAHLPGYSMDALRAVRPLFSVTNSLLTGLFLGSARGVCAAVPLPLQHLRARDGGRAGGAGRASRQARSRPSCAAVAKNEGPLVLLLPAEDDTDKCGAEGVVCLVEDDGLTARERYRRQVEEEEGPGAAEREMELLDEMQMQCRYNGYRDIDDFRDLDDFEEEEGAGAGRKHSVDELEPEGRVDDAHAHVARGGTPPKRARTGERDLSTVQLVKRGPEELDGEEGDTEPESAGSAPKRARVDTARQPAHVQHARHTVGRGVLRRVARTADPPPHAQHHRCRQLSSHTISIRHSYLRLP